MPNIYKNIFEDISVSLNENVNPYLKILKDSRQCSQTPIIYGSELMGLSGTWKELFQSRHPHKLKPKKIILEIGCHKGNILKQLAIAHPQYSFIGMDITFKRVVTTAQKAQEAGLHNMISILGDARHLLKIFQNHELDGIIAFFPDPWEKKRSQVGKRLFNHEFVRTLKHALSPHGFFWFKTDSKSYFKELQDFTNDLNFKYIDHTERLFTKNYRSTFENLFVSQNLPTFEAWWQM